MYCFSRTYRCYIHFIFFFFILLLLLLLTVVDGLPLDLSSVVEEIVGSIGVGGDGVMALEHTTTTTNHLHVSLIPA